MQLEHVSTVLVLVASVLNVRAGFENATYIFSVEMNHVSFSEFKAYENK